MKKEGGHMKEISLKPSAKQEIGKERERESEREIGRERVVWVKTCASLWKR